MSHENRRLSSTNSWLPQSPPHRHSSPSASRKSRKMASASHAWNTLSLGFFLFIMYTNSTWSFPIICCSKMIRINTRADLAWFCRGSTVTLHFLKNGAIKMKKIDAASLPIKTGLLCLLTRLTHVVLSLSHCCVPWKANTHASKS